MNHNTMKAILTLILSFLLINCLTAQEKPLVFGSTISKSIKFKKSIYTISASTDATKPILIIEGKNINIDFNNATLKSSLPIDKPNEFTGIAIIVRNGKNISIKNLTCRGYKIGLIAENVTNLSIENCDFSYNYRQHLNSTLEKEDISDWMSYHKNENDEWLRYGAAMYLKDCKNFLVRNCKVTGGQNALMLMRCNFGHITNNDFSFNSGIGIGMYRSSNNSIYYNRAIFNVRGYSHGIYNRGQDSAGFLVYEQSNNNVFYKNNVTHGGDGFFLWAGQTTMDSGEGGCNNNSVLGNDFSYAPTNGIEATFSRNTFNGNIVRECDHGVWGGYSFKSDFIGNEFSGNRIGIAIEHGQYNQISNNTFSDNKTAIKLWANKSQPSDWGYANKRDTRNIGTDINSNVFRSNNIAFDLLRADSLSIQNNHVSRSNVFLKKDSSVTNLFIGKNDSSAMPLAKANYGLSPSLISKGKPIQLPDATYAGRKNIMVTEWGPYDFRSPIIWNTNPTDTGKYLQFDVIGPRGNWKIKAIKGVKNVSLMQGSIPAKFTAEKIVDSRTDIAIDAEYTGMALQTPFGEKLAVGKPYNFHYNKFFQPIKWEINFYDLDTTVHNPISDGSLFSPTEKKAPFKTEYLDKIDYAWWGGIKQNNLQHTQFITAAVGSAEFLPGQYEISFTWDDAIRLYIDEKLVVNEWEPSKYNFDESPNKKIVVALNGLHHFRVEHVELGGFATLAVKFKKLN